MGELNTFAYSKTARVTYIICTLDMLEYGQSKSIFKMTFMFFKTLKRFMCRLLQFGHRIFMVLTPFCTRHV